MKYIVLLSTSTILQCRHLWAKYWPILYRQTYLVSDHGASNFKVKPCSPYKAFGTVFIAYVLIWLEWLYLRHNVVLLVYNMLM
jgi:hypothetical protein